jgi:hypothetical protein
MFYVRSDNPYISSYNVTKVYEGRIAPERRYV